MSGIDLLRIAYVANICILAPVCASLLFGDNGQGVLMLEGKALDSPCLRYLVASLWCGVLLCSVAGLFSPLAFIALLLFQVVYKLVFLAGYVAPRLWSKRWREIPWGVTLSFAAIVAVYPVILWRAL